MSTINVSDIPLDGTRSPAEHLRRTAAAVRVSYCWWGIKKTLTAGQKQEAAEPFGANGDYLTASKKLVDSKNPSYRALTSLKGRIGHYWKGISLPYVEPGMRLIKQSDVEPFVQQMNEFKREMENKSAELDNVLWEIKAEARDRLGRLYNEDDYPRTVQGLFGVEWDFPSVEPPSYLMRISPDVYEQECNRVAARFSEAVALAEQSFTAELHGLVEHLTERLQPNEDGTRRVFRDTAITNMTEFFDRFRRLGLRSNADLDRLVDQAQAMVNNVSADDLRDLPSVRTDLANRMGNIAEQLDGMIVNQPRRRIVRRAKMEVA